MDTDRKTGTLTLQIVGTNDQQSELPIMMTGVLIRILPVPTYEGASQDQLPERQGTSGADGQVIFRELPVGRYNVFAGPKPSQGEPTPLTGVEVLADCDSVREVRLGITLTLSLITGDDPVSVGPLLNIGSVIPYARRVRLHIMWRSEDHRFFASGTLSNDMSDARVGVLARGIGVQQLPWAGGNQRNFRLFAAQSGPASFLVYYGAREGRFSSTGLMTFQTEVPPAELTTIEGALNIGLRRTPSRFTEDIPLWVSIRRSTDALSFDRYYDFMNWLFCNDPPTIPPMTANPHIFDRAHRRHLPFTDTDAYRNIKVATEAFVMANCGIFTNLDNPDDAQYVIDQVVVPPRDLQSAFDGYREPLDAPGSPGVLPYLAIIRRKLADQRIKETDIGDVMLSLQREQVDACFGLLRQKLTCPCLLELIWSYWQEEGMLVQTMNTLARRFQNIRSPTGNDPLANLEIDPLRPLNNVIWGYIQDEQHRLGVVRRNYEYDHHYGLRLAGRAVREVRTADSRSKFLEAFHTLLSITSAFYKRDDDTTIVADGFPVLNGLKEAHLILSQGAHNQFGDLPSTARIEMLMEQWILSRPEFREFLPTRIMVAYPEPWMDRVDAMKKLQGWTDTSVLHFRNLAIFGEQVLLSIRYGAWADVNDPVQATNWARYWRPEIQGYMHAYRSATGIDLSVDVTNARIDATMPSVHLVQRLVEQQRSA